MIYEHILQISLLLLLLLTYCNGRVIYIMAHAEKPDDEDNEELRRISSMEGLGNPDDGLVCIILSIYLFNLLL